MGLSAKAGRYGGTYAHKDIAFEFGTWISPEFKLYLIKEFQRLKEQENYINGSDWDYRRFLSKVNYRLHTDAIRDTIIPVYEKITKEQEGYIYANEAELLNVAVFGITSKQWRDQNNFTYKEGRNIRDTANILQLTVLSNLENYNSILIKEGILPHDRFQKLKDAALSQFKALSKHQYAYPLEKQKKTSFK